MFKFCSGLSSAILLNFFIIAVSIDSVTLLIISLVILHTFFGLQKFFDSVIAHLIYNVCLICFCICLPYFLCYFHLVMLNTSTFFLRICCILSLIPLAHRFLISLMLYYTFFLNRFECSLKNIQGFHLGCVAFYCPFL